MKTIFILASIFAFTPFSFAAGDSLIICQSEDYTFSAQPHGTSQSESIVAVVKNGENVFKEVFNLLHEGTPVEAWIFRDLNKASNIMAVVTTDPGIAVVDANIELTNGETLRVHGADCTVE